MRSKDRIHEFIYYHKWCTLCATTLDHNVARYELFCFLFGCFSFSFWLSFSLLLCVFFFFFYICWFNYTIFVWTIPCYKVTFFRVIYTNIILFASFTLSNMNFSATFWTRNINFMDNRLNVSTFWEAWTS